MKVEERAIKRKSFLFIICLYNLKKRVVKNFKKRIKSQFQNWPWKGWKENFGGKKVIYWAYPNS